MVLRLGVLGVALLASVASTLNPDDPLPPTDDCFEPAVVPIDSVSLLDPDADVVMQDYQIHELIYGSQGGTMVRMRFRTTGPEAPSCLPMTLVYEKCLDLDCTAVDPDTSFPVMISLRVYEDGADRVTKEFYGQLPYSMQTGDLARVTVDVGSEAMPVTSSVFMWLGEEGQLEPFAGDAGL